MPATSSAHARTARSARTSPREPSSQSPAGKQVEDPDAVWSVLDKTRAKHPDIVILHGGAPGVETLAARWADTRGVDQVVCRPDWTAHGKAAPFKRNDDLLNLMPKGVLAWPGNGITANLVDKATALGIPVHRVRL